MTTKSSTKPAESAKPSTTERDKLEEQANQILSPEFIEAYTAKMKDAPCSCGLGDLCDVQVLAALIAGEATRVQQRDAAVSLLKKTMKMEAARIALLQAQRLLDTMLRRDDGRAVVQDTEVQTMGDKPERTH